jgi:hypothetical protein
MVGEFAPDQTVELTGHEVREARTVPEYLDRAGHPQSSGRELGPDLLSGYDDRTVALRFVCLQAGVAQRSSLLLSPEREQNSMSVRARLPRLCSVKIVPLNDLWPRHQSRCRQLDFASFTIGDNATSENHELAIVSSVQAVPKE